MDWDAMDWTGLSNGPMWMDGGRWTMGLRTDVGTTNGACMYALVRV